MKELLLVVSVVLCFVSTHAQSSVCSTEIQEDSIQFSKRSVFLNWVAKKKLYHVALVLNRNPDCKIVVLGFGNSCLSCRQTSWDRIYSVVKYLRQWGVDSSRFIFSFAQDGYNPLLVSIRSLIPGEDGPAIAQPSIPCYSYHHLTKKRCKGSL